MKLKSKRVPRYVIDIPKRLEWFKLIVIGDFHYGHKNCDVEGLKDTVNWLASKKPGTHRVILTGDNTENIIPGSKGSHFELDIADPIEQEDGMVEILDPIKHMIIASYDGNHAHRSRIASGHSPDEQIATKLGIRKVYMGYSGYLRLVFPQQSYTIWGEHGHSNARTLAGKIRVLSSMGRNHPDADIYVMGHIHQKIALPDHVEVVKNGRIYQRKIIYVSNGSYLEDPDYAVRLGYIHSGPGVARVEINTQRKDVHCSV